jgi:hypothetical protein
MAAFCAARGCAGHRGGQLARQVRAWSSRPSTAVTIAGLTRALKKAGVVVLKSVEGVEDCPQTGAMAGSCLRPHTVRPAVDAAPAKGSLPSSSRSTWSG